MLSIDADAHVIECEKTWDYLEGNDKRYRPVPIAVDMPTMWAHSITNVGTGELVTLFWSNELFDPERPDTYAEPVG